jgi:carbamoyl-phosphate synthase large subunit
MKRLNILVTGVGGPAGVNTAKLLMKYSKNFKIFGVDINSHSAGQFFSHQFFICERVSDEQKYLKWTKDFILKNKIDLVIPTVAEELVLMEKLQKIIPERVKILVSGNQLLELCDEKDRLYGWMTKNLPEYMGKWVRLDKKDISKKIFKAKNYFIKPVKGRGSRGCRQVTHAELLNLLKNDKANMKNFIAMEVLPGREWTVDCYVNDDGKFAYITPRLRLGLSGGISQIGQTDNDKRVIETAKKIFETLSSNFEKQSKVYGPVFVQLKEDENGIPKMVEVNPRASGGLSITALSGANMADCVYAEIIKRKPLYNLKWKEVTVTRYFEDKIVKSKK